MPKILYSTTSSGLLYAKWPGFSRRVIVTNGGITRVETRKFGQIQLGYVIDKEKNIFFKRVIGLYKFNPDDQSCKELNIGDLPEYKEKLDVIEHEKHVDTTFGGCYFLDSLIKGIGYDNVLESMEYRNLDRLYTMLYYYTLTTGPAYKAMSWYKHNYVSLLYPDANPASQRVSEFLAEIGSSENIRNFFLSHIKYILKSTDEELCILVDSTGMPNKCNLPVTCVSSHNGELSVGFRVIVVVQKSTGIPVFFQLIKGNIVDSNTITNLMDNLRNLGYNVTYALGDAAYSCPSNIERLILAGVDFLTRLNPAYDHFKTALADGFEYMNDVKNAISFNGRPIIVHKMKMVIARDKTTGEDVEGYVYLCRDIAAQYSKAAHLLNSKKLSKMSMEEINDELEKFGIFALLSTKDIPETQVLKEYYTRQGIEQFFDYEKNYSAALPVRVHNFKTLKGHLLMGFISTFLVILIKNKLKIMDTPFAVVPTSLKDEMGDTPYVELDTQQGIELMIRQYKTEPGNEFDMQDEELKKKMKKMSKTSPKTLFEDLQMVNANVYPNEVVPDISDADANLYFKAFHIDVPRFITREGNGLKSPTYHSGQGNRCTRRLVFSRRSSLTPEQVEERKKKGELKKLMAEAEKQGYSLVPLASQKNDNVDPQTDTDDSLEKGTVPETPEGASACQAMTPEAATAPAESSDSKAEVCPKPEETADASCEVSNGGVLIAETSQPSQDKPIMELPPALSECIGASAGAAKQTEKRGRGRPKGSKNRKGKDQETDSSASAKPVNSDSEGDQSAPQTADGTANAAGQAEKRGRGRPKGSKNRKGKDQETDSSASAKPVNSDSEGDQSALQAADGSTGAVAEQTEQYGRGRPKGDQDQEADTSASAKPVNSDSKGNQSAPQTADGGTANAAA